jgi:hypothetical protein
VFDEELKVRSHYIDERGGGSTIFSEISQDSANIGLESHIKHPIRLIENEITIIINKHFLSSQTRERERERIFTEHGQDQYNSSSWHLKDDLE